MAEFDWNNYLESIKGVAVPEELFSHVSFEFISVMLFNIFLNNYSTLVCVCVSK